MWWWKKWPEHAALREDIPSETLEYLAAFVQAGLSATSAWQEIPGNLDSESPLRAIQEALQHSGTLADAIERATLHAAPEWRMLGATWSVARDSGSPLAPGLEVLAASMMDRDHIRREIAATLTGPAATMRLVMVLPLLALGGGAVTGADTAGILFATPLGLTALGLAIALMGAAWWWMRILQRDALPDRNPEELALELFSIATAGGALPEQAWSLVGEALEKYEREGSTGSEGEALTALSRRVGVPVSGLARARARLIRHRWRSEALASVNRLGVTMVIPLGVLVLPAFVLVAIVPMALALWTQATAT